ncbi:ABC transporter substrate-binding protein [Agromyces sp. NPDC049794]|uniref:ABC transporter substrate-binding protein n=1 Tax=unclassified Agromyces TaxID=2639701 RepID=UPI003407DC37
MRSRNTFAAVALTAVMIAGLSACAPESSSAPDPSPTSEAVQGGDATIILGVEAVRGLDPAFLFNLTPSGDANRMSAIYDVLFWSDAKTGEVTPQIGESLTPDDDGTEWTLTLNEGVAFTDGTPLDAEAVVFNYERIQDPATSSPLAGLLADVTFDVVDETTLTITLPEPNLQFDKVLATSLTHIASPTAIAEDPDFANNPVGAGPFVLEEWVRDDHMTLVRNDDYFVDGQPYLDSITFKPIKDPTQRINAVTTGQAHAAIPGSELAFKESATTSGLDVTSAPTGGGPLIMFNLEQAPFDDLRARQAVQLALDIADLTAVVDPGSTAPDSFFGPESAFHPEKSAFVEADQEAAQELFDELAEEGAPVSFAITMPASGFFTRTAEYLQSRLSQFENVTVTIDTVDNATLDERVFRNQDYQMSAQIVPVTDPEPNLAKLLRTDGQTNYMGYSNPDVDDALDAGRDSTDAGERAEAYAEVERLVVEDVPVLPIRNQEAYTVHAAALQGLTLHGDGSLLFDRLWLAADGQ